MRIIITFIAVCLLAGCSTRPDAIAAKHVSPAQFASLECSELAAALRQRHTIREELYIAQNADVDRDAKVAAGGGLLIGIFIAPFVGNDESQVDAIRKVKGEIAAIESVQLANGCFSEGS